MKIEKNHLYILAAIVALAIIFAGITGAMAPAVAIGDTVKVDYTGTLTNGTQFDTSIGKQPLEFTVGSGEVIKGFEQAIIGMRVNEEKTVTITPDQGYGYFRPDLIVQIPIKKFGNQTIRVGMLITESAGGQQIRGIVKQFNATNVTVDFNPPLAGKTLIFKIKVVAIQKK